MSDNNSAAEAAPLPEMVKVRIRCEQMVVYSVTREVPQSVVDEYEAACDADESDQWFSDFADRYIDPLTHASDSGDQYDDVELIVLKDQKTEA